MPRVPDFKKIKFINYDYAKYGASAERRRLIGKWEKDVNSPAPLSSPCQTRGQIRARRIVAGWLLLGLAAFVLLPWYYPQNLTLLKSLPGVFGGPDTASGVLQALQHHKPWLWIGLLGWRWPAVGGRCRPGGAGLAAAGRRGARAWAACWPAALPSAHKAGRSTALGRLFGELASGQFGIGVGGALVLLALLMLLGAGIARLGYFRGDLFVAGAVVFCSALLLLFVALPVGKSLIGAFLDEAGSFSLPALAERLGQDRVWGLSCVVGGVRCGVAWNTLFLALLTAPAPRCWAR
jgi:iron(III) transport system permease protein